MRLAWPLLAALLSADAKPAEVVTLKSAAWAPAQGSRARATRATTGLRDGMRRRYGRHTSASVSPWSHLGLRRNSLRAAMDFSLTDEQQLIRETARDFAHKVVRPRADENARKHHFDVDLAKQIADQGYLGAIIPRDYGGAGLDYVTYGLVVEEIGAVDSAMRTVISVQTSLVCSAILRWGTEEQKQHYLPKLCSGEWLGCFGLTEPDTGSDAANQRTRAI